MQTYMAKLHVEKKRAAVTAPAAAARLQAGPTKPGSNRYRFK